LNIAAVIVAAIVMIAMIVLFHFTPFGRQVRALASDRMAAELQGVRTRRMSMLSFGIAGALAGLAGLLIAPGSAVTPELGFNPMLFAFAAAILGGFGRIG